MVTPDSTLSVAGRHALQDMVELQMYLVAQPQNAPWPMLPRRNKGPHDDKRRQPGPVESSAVRELMHHGLIEATSNRTYVVSKSGYEFNQREMKRSSA